MQNKIQNFTIYNKILSTGSDSEGHFSGVHLGYRDGLLMAVSAGAVLQRETLSAGAGTHVIRVSIPNPGAPRSH